MSDTTPQGRHADDARADDAAPTDGITDEVRTDAIAEDNPDAAQSESKIQDAPDSE